MFPTSHHVDRLNNYTDHESDLDWSGLTFPVTLPDISKFERRNQISINVYGWELKASCFLLCKSDLIDSKQHIDLLLLQGEGGDSHYSWIKAFSRFAPLPVSPIITVMVPNTIAVTACMDSPPLRNWKRI